jgi:hypothetical protein
MHFDSKEKISMTSPTKKAKAIRKWKKAPNKANQKADKKRIEKNFEILRQAAEKRRKAACQEFRVRRGGTLFDRHLQIFDILSDKHAEVDAGFAFNATVRVFFV